MALAFTVHGVPQPQGSTRAFRHRHTGRIVTTSDNPRLYSWRHAAASAAAHARAEAGIVAPFDGPVRVTVSFIFARPKSVSAKRRPAHTVKPDADKLVRALFDSMSGIAWRDDAQVVRFSVWKDYGVEPKTIVQIEDVA